MGYMGFGMRKEDYTRKPKKSFDKLKGKYGKELNIPHVDPVAGEVVNKGSFQRREFKHFSQTRIFKAIMLLVVATGLWLGLLKGYWFQYREYRYQKSGILAEYSAKQNMYLSLRDYFRKREGKLIRIEANNYDSLFFLSIKDVRRNKQTPDSLRYDWNEWGMHKDVIQPVVKGQKLMTGFDQRTFDYWQCFFSSYKIENLDPSFFEYLETTKSEFNNIAKTIRREQLGVKNEDAILSISYVHPEFGRYAIVFADKQPESLEKKNFDDTEVTTTGKIEEHVFWSTTKTERPAFGFLLKWKRIVD